MKNGIILMSHGLMAQEALNSAKMILGNQIDYPVISMEPNDGLEGTINKLDATLSILKDCQNIIIMADLMGGTPANVAVMRASTDDRIQIITGMNLGMILESFFAMENDDLAEHLLKIGYQGIQIPKISFSDSEE